MSTPTKVKNAASILPLLETQETEDEVSVQTIRALPSVVQHGRYQSSLGTATAETSPTTKTSSKPQIPPSPDTSPNHDHHPGSPSSNPDPQHLVDAPDISSNQRPYSKAVSLADGLIEDFRHVLDYDAIPERGFQEELIRAFGDGTLQLKSPFDFETQELELAQSEREMGLESSPTPEILSTLENSPSMPATTISTETTPKPVTTTQPTRSSMLDILPSFKTSLAADTLSLTPKSLLETVYMTNEALVDELVLGDLDACIDKLRVVTEKRGGGREAKKELEVAIEKLKFLERQVLAIKILGATEKLKPVGGVQTVEKSNTIDANTTKESVAVCEQREKSGTMAELLRCLGKMNVSRRQKVRAWGKKLARIKVRMWRN
ncbi:hypothetical protein E2P81_ATG09862 [Venturia nashicola]|uniref:Uncharacterized protein n=1 Tax=Venturia nashicola TaxID=86259 RepID=A0A4Z1NGM6_9PEZI|nr:hypothetical protein E6O75_ATG10079 [Venturia nashicola]TLD15014.1 hypothetical protein E2P81_ATG09862 [Venturia nashicola]